VDILVPPLSRVVAAAGLGVAVAVAGAWATGDFVSSRAAFGASLAGIAAYVLRGWMVSGTGLRGLADLAMAPGYMVWKLGLSRRAKARTDAEWIRTTREGAPPE